MVRDEIVAGLHAQGLAVVRDFLSPAAIAALRTEALRRDAAGELAPAGVGPATGRIVRGDIRGDRIGWLDDERPAPAEAPLLRALAALRDAVNRELWLNLRRFEGHYALYPPGAFYVRHRDRFCVSPEISGERVLSCVVYLNEGWTRDDGGVLRIHFDDGTARDVLPTGGTLVAFLAADFEHEVLPATRPRLAVTGWFRTRGSGVD
jgi:SM-20-related protein